MRSTRRFSDLSTPIRACINGLRSSAARINASIRCLPVGGFLTGGSKTFRPPTMSGGMKKVKFDNSQSIELQKALPGAELTPEQLTVMHIEGWLVDDHVCVQKPAGDAGWRVSLYPWGDRISGEFYFKADAVEYAKDVSRLGIDWDAVYEPRHYAKTAIYRQALSELSALRDAYEDGGYFKL